MGRRVLLGAVVGVILAACSSSGGPPTGPATNPSSTSANPTATHPPVAVAAPVLVPVGSRSKLQSLLDQNGSIQLLPNSDYSTGGPTSITVSSGQQIFGGWNTSAPQIIIPGGVTNVVISGLQSAKQGADDVVFSAGNVTSNVRIVGSNGATGKGLQVRVSAGAHVEQLELAQFGHLIVDQAQSGYVRDSVFTFGDGYSPQALVAWNGNIQEASGPNALIGMFSITGRDASFWNSVGKVWLVAWDAESWNANGDGSPNPFTFTGATEVVSVGLSGGTAVPARDGAVARYTGVTGVMSWFDQAGGGTIDGADVLFQQVGTRLASQPHPKIRIIDQAPNGLRLHLLDPTVALPVALSGGAAVTNAAALTKVPPTLDWAAGISPPRYPSGKPLRRSISDPLGDDWQASASSQPDSSAPIQAQIDAAGTVNLAPGVYYLDHPLKIGSPARTEAILGAGRDQTVLVAKGSFPVVQGRGDFHYATGGSKAIRVALNGLTLYGGTDGLRLTSEPGNIGDAGTIVFSMFADLKFLRQSEAGVLAQGIYGLDNNLWYQADFLNLPAAILGSGSGVVGGMNYADKQHFIDCQFQGISGPVWNWKSTRPSGGEVFSGDYYYNVAGLSETTSAWTIVWSNSVMENVTAGVAIHAVDGPTTSTRNFYQYDDLWIGSGPTVVEDSLPNAIAVGVQFQQNSGSIVAQSGAQSFNAIATATGQNVTQGNVTNGVFVNSQIGTSTSPLQIFSGSSLGLGLSL